MKQKMVTLNKTVDEIRNRFNVLNIRTLSIGQSMGYVWIFVKSIDDANIVKAYLTSDEEKIVRLCKL